MQAVVKHRRNLGQIARLVILLLHNGGQNQNVVGREVLAGGVFHVHAAQLVLHGLQHQAHDVFGRGVVTDRVGAGEQAALQLLGAHFFKEAELAGIHTGVLASLLEFLGRHVSVLGHHLRNLLQGVALRNREGVARLAGHQRVNQLVDVRAANEVIQTRLQGVGNVQLRHPVQKVARILDDARVLQRIRNLARTRALGHLHRNFLANQNFARLLAAEADAVEHEEGQPYTQGEGEQHTHGRNQLAADGAGLLHGPLASLARSLHRLVHPLVASSAARALHALSLPCVACLASRALFIVAIRHLNPLWRPVAFQPGLQK